MTSYYLIFAAQQTINEITFILTHSIHCKHCWLTGGRSHRPQITLVIGGTPEESYPIVTIFAYKMVFQH
jgi:hypothetical protein